MREMRTGMPFGYIHARKGRRDDRAGTCGKLHRLRALRGRMSDGLRVAQRIPAGENAYDRLQPNAYAGAGDVADQSRRSNRTLTSRPVPKEMLDKIVEAAHSAPTATNSQSLSFTVVTDPQKLRQVSDYTIGVFDSLAKLLLNPVVKCVVKPFMKDVYKYVPVFNRLKEEHKAGKDPILRKATALLLIHTPKSNRFGSEDANLAYQNASLMAQSLGVSQIYMGFVLTAIRHEGKDTLAKTLGIDGKIQAIMALGIPAFKYPKYTDRKEIVKNYIE